MEVIDTQDNDDGTITTTYSNGTYVQTDSVSGKVVDQGSTITQINTDGSESADLNGFTYRKNADGSFSKIDESGVTHPSSKAEYTAVTQKLDPGATATLPASQVSATPTTERTSTTTSGPNLLTQMQNLLKGGGLGTAGGVAALTAISKALGGGLVNPGGTTGVHRGYQGGIPELTANRTMNKIPADYRPGGGGMTYFSPLTFTNPAGKVISGVGGSGSPMNAGDATGNVTGPTMAGALTPTNTNLPGGITNVGNTAGLAQQFAQQLAEQRAQIDAKNKADAADKLTAAKLASDKLTADKLATEKTAADTLAAETARKGTQTALGNIVAKYPNATKDSHQMNQRNVELANYMDTHGVKAADLPSILKGASYGQDWTPDVINSTYKSIDPLAQVISAYNDKTKTPAQVAALAAQNNITTQQLQDYGVDTTSLNNLATQGYLSTPLLTDTLKQDYNAGTSAGIASINSILASNPSLTAAKIQEMFPGIDLNEVAGKGVKIPGFDPTAKASMQQAMGAATQQNYPSTSSTPSNMASVFTQGMANNGIVPSAGGIGSIAGNTGAASTPAAATPAAIKPAAPVYKSYTPQQITDYFASNPGANVAAATQQFQADPAAVATALGAVPNMSAVLAANNPAPAPAPAPAPDYYGGGATGDAAGGIIKSHYAMGGFAPGGISGLGSYSDGGRMLKGPGDGVSDSIPAVIGGHQKAALADGEFVVPARIVSEIGNGSSDAGARKLYAMMDRIQNARKKTTKNVAANTRAEKYLPA